TIQLGQKSTGHANGFVEFGAEGIVNITDDRPRLFPGRFVEQGFPIHNRFHLSFSVTLRCKPAQTFRRPRHSSLSPRECSPPGPGPHSRGPPGPALSWPVAAHTAASRCTRHTYSSGRRHRACS